MGAGLIIAGMLFLVNPCYNIIDFLPDFIGFFLIYKGLSKTSVFEGRLSESRDIFFRLALIDLSKIAVLFLFAAGRSGSTVGPDGMTLDALSMRASSETYILVATFIYAVIEVIFFTGAVNALFSGFDTLGRRFPSVSVNATKTVGTAKNGEPVKRDVSVSVRNVTVIFFAVRCAASVLCELPALSLSSHYGEVTTGMLTAERMRPTLYILSSVAVIAFGIVFAFMSTRYWNSVRRDAPFISAIGEAYREFDRDNPTVRLGKRMRTITVFFIIACFLSIRITDSEMTVLPGAFCALFMLETAFLMRDFFKKKSSFIAVIVTSALYGVVSTASYVLESRFFSDYSRLEVFRLKGAAHGYPPVAVLESVDGLLLAFSITALAFMFFKASASHVIYAGEEFHVSDKITFEVDKYRDELAAALKKRRRIAVVSCLIHFAFRFAVPIVEPFFFLLFPPVMQGGREVDVPGSATSYLTFAYFAFSAVWIVSMIVYCLFASAEMYKPMAKGEK